MARSKKVIPFSSVLKYCALWVSVKESKAPAFTRLSNDFLFATNFKNCQLDLSNFYKLNLKKTQFINCSLKEVDFSESNLTESILQNCDLNQSVFII